MKKIFIFLSFIAVGSITFAKDKTPVCADTVEVNYKKVMSSAFAKDYEKCPVIITGQYFKDGFVKQYKQPSKFKNMYFFQCVAIDGDGSPMPATNEIAGNFFVIDKSRADEVLNLKKGDKVRVTGKTFTSSYMGMMDMDIYFIVEKIEVIE